MNKIQVETIVNSNLSKVWEIWNNPEKIKLWAFANDDWECTYAKNDLYVGGTFTIRMSSKDKSTSFDFAGTYTDIKKKEKINYVIKMDPSETIARKCEVTFKDMGEGKTMIIEKFDPEDQNSLELQKVGWQNILNNFKKFVETPEEPSFVF